MLFPQLGPQYYDERHKDILARMEAFYAEGISINQAFWQEADTDTRFYMGDQSVWNDLYGNLSANKRQQFSFNRLMRIINMIDGYQRRNRKSTIAVGVENHDNKTADQITKALMWVNKQAGALETISDSFRGALVTGMNLMQVWVDYRSDPISGNIKVDNCSYNSFLIDPYFRKPDLSDCNAIWKRSFLTKRDCISLLPDFEEEIMALQGNDSSRDGKFQFMPESYNYGAKNLLSYDEFYYRDYRKQKMLVDSETGESTEWKSEDKDRLKQFLQLYPQITVIEQDIPTVRCAILVQGKVMYDGPNPLGIDRYPFVPTFAYYTPESPYLPLRAQGVIRGLRSAQYLYNRRKIIELDILESQINSGFKYKEDALVNPTDIFLSGQGKGLALKSEALMTDVEQIIAPAIQPGVIQLSEILGKEIQEIAGVSEELLGTASDDMAGVLSMLRQGAGLTTLQHLFDRLDQSQKLLGEIQIELIQNNFTPGKMQKILGEQPSDQFYNKYFGKYGAVVEEGLNTSTQKQMNFAQLLQLRQLLGDAIPADVLIDASTLQNKDKLMESINKHAQQAQQAQQAQLELQQQEVAATIEMAKAKAAADRGMSAERYSRIEENHSLAMERQAEARKNDEQALLNLVKTLKEIDGIDIDQAYKIDELAQIIKQRESDRLNDSRQTEKNTSMVEA